MSEETEVQSGYRFAAIPEWIVFAENLSAVDVRVFAALARHANGHRKCWPGREALAERLGMNERTIRRSISALVDAGALKVQHRTANDGRQTTNLYLLAGDVPFGQNRPGRGVSESTSGGVPESTEVEPEEVKPNPPTPQGGESVFVQRVFDAWIAACERDPVRTKFSVDRRRVIEKALKSYPVDDVLAAVRGWKNSPYHRGENQQKMVYNEITLLLRTPTHIERFRDLALKPVPKTEGDVWNDWLDDYHRNRPSALTRDAG